MRGILAEFASVSGLVVAGGRATRMGGREKPLLPAPGGATIAERTVALLRSLAADVMVASPRAEAWSSLPVRLVADERADAGPLAGLAAGLAAARTPLVLAVAGDMPLLRRDVMRELVVLALATGRCVVPLVDGRPEPLHAVYRSALASRAREALDSGGRKVTSFLREGDVHWLDAGPGAARSFANVNTPEDLAGLVDGAPGRRHT